jgi:AcrR family transcriptional regulator
MGRPAEFDRDQALGAAIRVFARHGFSAASLSDLLEGMGIARQSLYGAFGDKRRLFLEALERYSDVSRSRMQAAMDNEDTALAALEAALMIDLGTGADLETGCLGVGSIAEFGRSDPEVNAMSDRAGAQIAAMLANRVRDGMASGELKATLDADEVARMLLTLKSGLKISARGGDDQVRRSARLVLCGLAAE